MKFKPGSLGFTLLLATLSALPPLSIDLYLSTLSVLGQSFHCSPSSVGLSISVFLGSFACSQLLSGPLSDRFGRRPVGIIGCLLFAISGIGCTLANSISAFLFWRLVQGVGAGAANVLAFAIIRDVFTGNAARSQFAFVNATQAFAPMAAPLVGSWIFQLAGWRANLGVLALGAIALTVAFAWGFEESLSKKRPSKLSPRRLVRNYSKVLSNRASAGYCLISAFVLGSMLAFVTASSFLFVDGLGVSRPHFGMILLATSCGVMAGSALSGKLSKRHVPQPKVMIGSLGLNLLAALSLLLLSCAGWFAVATAIPLLLLLTLSTGLLMPSAAHGALAPMGKVAGTAAALFGACGSMGSTLASGLVSFFGSASPVGLSSVMFFFSLLATAAYTLLVAPVELGLEADGESLVDIPVRAEE